jgi:hypothetical protein
VGDAAPYFTAAAFLMLTLALTVGFQVVVADPDLVVPTTAA